MKKLIAGILCAVMTLCLCACGNTRTITAKREYVDDYYGMQYTVLTYELKGDKVKAVYHEDVYDTAYNAQISYRQVVSQFTNWKDYDLRVTDEKVTYHEIDLSAYKGMDYDELIEYIENDGYTISDPEIQG